LNFENPKLRDG